MAANAISGLGKPRDRFRDPESELPEAPRGDSDETVSQNSAGPGKTHETVSKAPIGDAKHTISLETVSKSSARTSKRTILSIKRAIGHTKHTIPSETVSKMKDLKPPGETWAGEAKFLENGRVPNPL